MRRWPGAKELLPLAFTIVVLISGVALSRNTWRHANDAKSRASAARQVIIDSNALLSSLKDAETGQRGFLLTGREVFLAPYRQALPEIANRRRALLRDSIGNENEVSQERNIDLLVDQKLDELRLTIDLRSRNPQAALRAVDTDRGRLYMDEIRIRTTSLQKNAYGDLARYSAQSEELSRREYYFDIGRAVLIFALMAFATRLIYDGIVRREKLIAELSTQIERRQAVEARLLQSQKMEAIGRLAGGVAHDFNNLLTVILGYGEILRSRILDQGGADCIAEILHAGRRATDLTGQLLAFGRSRSSSPQVINITESVRAAVKLLSSIIGEDIEIVASCAPDLGNILADPIQIHRILMNLALNARDAMPNGGRLLIEAGNSNLTHDHVPMDSRSLLGPCVLLAVTDTGTGMDRETQDRIFEPFFTTKEQGKGTGLGLSIVYGEVKQAGGDIQVYSELGRGSTFKLYFPEVVGRDQAAQTPATTSSPAGGSEQILFVEDDAAVRKLVTFTLEEAGYEVIQAFSPGAAIEAVEKLEAKPQLLLTDVVMPQMNGPDLAAQLAICCGLIKVVYISGYTPGGISNSGMLEAGSNYLEKPFSREQLLVRLRAVLDGVD